MTDELMMEDESRTAEWGDKMITLRIKFWTDNIADRLVAALRQPSHGDRRSQLGLERGGRKLAADIAHRVADGVA